MTKVAKTSVADLQKKSDAPVVDEPVMQDAPVVEAQVDGDAPVVESQVDGEAQVDGDALEVVNKVSKKKKKPRNSTVPDVQFRRLCRRAGLQRVEKSSIVALREEYARFVKKTIARAVVYTQTRDGKTIAPRDVIPAFDFVIVAGDTVGDKARLKDHRPKKKVVGDDVVVIKPEADEKPPVKSTKRRRIAAMDVKHLRNTNGLIFDHSPFVQYCRDEIAKTATEMNVTEVSFNLLQRGVEGHLHRVIRAARMCAVHTDRTGLSASDVELAVAVMRMTGLHSTGEVSVPLENFDSAIRNLVKKTDSAPRVSADVLRHLSRLLYSIAVMVSQKASSLCSKTIRELKSKSVVSPKELGAALRILLPASTILSSSIDRAEKSVAKYKKSVAASKAAMLKIKQNTPEGEAFAKQKKEQKNSRAGLTLQVARSLHIIEENHGGKVGVATPVYLTAVLETIALRAISLMEVHRLTNNTETLTMNYLKSVMQNDEELLMLVSEFGIQMVF